MAGSPQPRVLVVDDHRSVRVFFLEVLSTLPVEADEAADVDQALSLLMTRPYDLIVSDYSMPGRTGLDLLKEVRERYPHVRFGIATGSSGFAFRGEIARSKPDFLLEKPVEVKTFLAAVSTALGI